MILKNCEFSFADGRGGTIVFYNVNLDEKFKNGKHQIKLNAIFSKSRIKIKFLNYLKGKNILKLIFLMQMHHWTLFLTKEVI